MTKRMGVGAAKAHFTELLRELEAGGERVTIERRGRPVAVLVPYDAATHAAAAPHWSEALRGIAADLPDFEKVMKVVVASRRRARARRVDLDD